MKFPFVRRARHDAELARLQGRLKKAKEIANKAKDQLQKSRSALEQLRARRARELARLREVEDLCEVRARELGRFREVENLCDLRARELVEVSAELAEARRLGGGADVPHRRNQFEHDLRPLLAGKLTGKGIEIGALHRPLPLPPGAVASYVDLRSREENIAMFPHLPAKDIVETSFVCDGQTLVDVPDESQDFVIANHILEHCVNTLLALQNFLRVLKPLGRLFIALPDKRFTFDFKRPATPWEHVLHDYQIGREVEEPDVYEEYRLYVDPKLDVAQAVATRQEIHHHSWTQAEILELFIEARRVLGWPLEIEFFAKQGSEVVLVLQKADPLHEDHSELYKRMVAEAAAAASKDAAKSEVPKAPASSPMGDDASLKIRDASAPPIAPTFPPATLPGVFPPDDRPCYMPVARTTDSAHVQIEQTWSNDLNVGLSGFALVSEGSPQDIRITCEGVPPEGIEWLDRPDVYSHSSFASYARHDRCGFRAWFRRRTHHNVTVALPGSSGMKQESLRLAATGFSSIPSCEPVGNAVLRFAEQVSRECRTVLEIGSRVVSPGSKSKRSLFAPHVQYTGFDYYPDANTDVVGDAHQLSTYFPEGKTFDAIFSMSVLEHLAAPWKAVLEINKLLPMGGLAFHAAPFTWPLHEEPWDFWRFSHEGLRALFSPALGFEVLSLGVTNPCRIHFEMPSSSTGHTPLHPAFGGSNILVRKVGEIPPENFRWSATLEQVLPPKSAYPFPVDAP